MTEIMAPIDVPADPAELREIERLFTDEDDYVIEEIEDETPVFKNKKERKGGFL